MRHYPRNAQARADALAGPGHIGNHGPADKATLLDRAKRVDPAVDAGNILAAYGGSA